MEEGGKALLSKELAISLLIMAVGIIYLMASLAYPLGDLVKPGPGMFPAVMAVLLILGGLRLSLAARRSPAAASRQGGKKRMGKFASVRVVLGTVAYLILMPLIGFLTMTFFFLIYMFKTMGVTSWARTIAASAVTSLLFYWFFIQVLLLTAPGGLLP